MAVTSVKDAIVLITGASSGIGEATAYAFAAEGARLLLAARRVEKMEAAAPKLRAAGAAEVNVVSLDVTRLEEVNRVLGEDLPEDWRAIDVLVNNAGLSRGLDKVHEGHAHEWDEMIDTNVKGLLYVTRAVVPGMVARGRGHVINLGSTAGEMTYPGGAVYCASKAAERAINDGLRQDLLGTRVRVTSIDPGMVETDFSNVRFRGYGERASKVYQGLIPLTPKDVAETIVWSAMRPAHVNIARVLLTSIDQANSLLLNRKS